ncbi:MAG: hypothetical protein ACI88C_002996 [Acidimicrobiales bacterium]|jgi:hypothetical protein
MAPVVCSTNSTRPSANRMSEIGSVWFGANTSIAKPSGKLWHGEAHVWIASANVSSSQEVVANFICIWSQSRRSAAASRPRFITPERRHATTPQPVVVR